MKTGRAFWGTLFVVVGILLVLERMNVVRLEWGYAWKLWPLLLVLLGIALLVKNRTVKMLIVAISAVFLGILLLGLVSFSWFEGEDDGGQHSTEQELVEPFDSTVQRASLSLKAGAGTFVVGETTDQLVGASIHSAIGRYKMTTDREGNAAHVRLTFEGKRVRWLHGRSANHAEIRLNRGPVWDFDCDVGAARLDLDLARYRTGRVRVHAGASDARVTLGTLSEETRLAVEAGASSVRISVPRASACEVKFDGGLSSKTLSDFQKIDSRTYRTENFDVAANKIYIKVDAGVSKIRVVRF